jgi:hypothetical protein
MSIPEIVVCRDEPSVSRVSGFYLIVFQRDPVATAVIAEEMQVTSEFISQRIAEFADKRLDVEWKLPTDPESRIIEFQGKSLRYSKIRFRILKALILASGKPVPYSVASQAGWGAGIDKEVLEDSVYQFNRFFERNGIPKFIRCDKEFLTLEDRKCSKRPSTRNKTTAKTA